MILGLGYVTTAGTELSYDCNWWITSTRREQWPRQGGKRGAGTAALVVECTDTWGWLNALTAPYTSVWEGLTVRDVITRVMTLVLREPVDLPDPSAALERVISYLLVDVDDQFLPFAAKLLRECGLCLRFVSAQTGAGGPSSLAAQALPAFTLWPGSPFLGGAGHAPILQAEQLIVDPAPNHIEVYSPNFFFHGEAFDWASIGTGRHIPDKYHTSQALDAGAADEIAACLVDWHIHAKHRTLVTIPYNVALELGDTVRLTSDWLGLNEAHRHVRGLHGRYSVQPARYELTLELHGEP